MKCKYLLIPLSLVYFFIVSARNIFYRMQIFRGHALDAKVISVGNITWGGTGKTPAVLFILRALLRQGKKPAILSRGYGNDEQELLSGADSGVPVLVGKDRVKSGLRAIAEYSADTLVLDDGFQYRRLKRDIDIVCIDAMQPFGCGWVIPAGSMREALNSLKRADIFLITKSDLIQDEDSLQSLENKLRRINPDGLIVRSIHKVRHLYRLSDEQMIDIGWLRKKNIVLVSAIGNPVSFEKTVKKLGLKAGRHFIFRDHHRYTEKELKDIDDYCSKNNIDTIVTTEKDAVKLRTAEYESRITKTIVLSIELEIIQNEERFYNRLFGIYNS